MKILLAAILVLSLVACNDVDVTEGRITYKDHVPAHTQSYQCGSIQVAEISIPQYCEQFVDDKWTISITADVNQDGKLDTDWVRVDEDTYNSVKTGDYYVIGQGVVLK